MFIPHMWRMKEDGAKSLLVIGEEATNAKQNAETLRVFWLVGWLVFTMRVIKYWNRLPGGVMDS